MKSPLLRAFLLLAAGIIISVFLFRVLRSESEAHHHEVDESLAELRAIHLAERLSAIAVEFQTLVSFYECSHRVDEDEFRRFVEPLLRHTDSNVCQIFAWAPVKRDSAGLLSFPLRFLARGDAVLTETRSIDLSQIPKIAAAAERAVASGREEVVVLPKNEPGWPFPTDLLLLRPFFPGGAIPAALPERSDRVAGIILSSLSTEEILELAVNNPASPNWNYALYLKAGPAVDSILLASMPVGIENRGSAGKRFHPSFFRLGKLEFQFVQSHSSAQELALNETAMAWIVLVSGLSLASLLAGAVFFRECKVQGAAEKMRMESLLMEQSRDSAVGRLAGSLAHEINNPLAVMGARLHILKEGAAGNPAVEEAADVLGRQVERIGRVVGGLLTFTRVSRRGEASGTLAGTVQIVADLFRAPLNKRGVQLSIPKESEIPVLKVDADEMQQVFVNLFQNAADALPEGGTIAVRIAENSEGIAVTVEDTGPGLSAEPEKVFEPFFSTKRLGAGLGLAVVRDIVTAHGGTIEAENVPPPGRGARFLIRLPRAAAVEGGKTGMEEFPEKKGRRS